MRRSTWVHTNAILDGVTSYFRMTRLQKSDTSKNLRRRWIRRTSADFCTVSANAPIYRRCSAPSSPSTNLIFFFDDWTQLLAWTRCWWLERKPHIYTPSIRHISQWTSRRRRCSSSTTFTTLCRRQYVLPKILLIIPPSITPISTHSHSRHDWADSSDGLSETLWCLKFNPVPCLFIHKIFFFKMFNVVLYP